MMSRSELMYSSLASRTGSRLPSSQELGEFSPSEKANRKAHFRQSESGQIIVEYVLILVITIAIATVMTRMMISRDEGDPGFVVKAWDQMLKEIGTDKPDDIKRGDELSP